MIEAIFWDNDGVLVDTEHLYYEATRRVLASVGIELTEELYRDLFLVQGKGAWHLAEAQGVPPERIQQLKDERGALYSRMIGEEPRLIPGVLDILQQLHGRYVMGIVTSSRRDHFDLIHRDTGLRKYFDFVITADDCPRTKPCPDGYAMAVARSGAGPEACLAVEDSERGVEAATAAGIRCVVVPSRLTRTQKFVGALYRLEAVNELPALLTTL
jgi:HAD superfamily hydrolase (TIGR01509 family)